jgi:hypothetical protein
MVKVRLLILSAFAVMLSLMPAPADARYCLRRNGSVGQGRCDFITRQACMRIAKVSRATCRPASPRFQLDPARMR